jgi:hypothetical protein
LDGFETESALSELSFEYSFNIYQALLKISNAYLNKKIPSIPDLRDEDGEEQWYEFRLIFI